MKCMPFSPLLIKLFYAIVAEKSDRSAYGIKQVKENLKIDAVDLLLLSENLTTTELLCDIENSNAIVVVVPAMAEECAQFDKAFGGIGAILSYETGI